MTTKNNKEIIIDKILGGLIEAVYNRKLIDPVRRKALTQILSLIPERGEVIAEIDKTFKDIEAYRKMRGFSENKADMAIWLNLETVEFLRSIIQPKPNDKDTPVGELADVLILAFDACNLYGIGGWEGIKKIIDAKMEKNYKKKYPNNHKTKT